MVSGKSGVLSSYPVELLFWVFGELDWVTLSGVLVVLEKSWYFKGCVHIHFHPICSMA